MAAPLYYSSATYHGTGTSLASTLSGFANRFMAVTLINDVAKTPSSVQYGGVALTNACSVVRASGAPTIHLYYGLETQLSTAGNSNVTWAYSGSTTNSTHVSQFYNVRQVAPYLTPSMYDENNATYVSLNMAITESNDLLYLSACNMADADGTWTPDAGYTEVVDMFGGGYWWSTSLYRIVSAPGSYTIGTTASQKGWRGGVGLAMHGVKSVLTSGVFLSDFGVM